MSVNITSAPDESIETIKHLLTANLFDVFGQRDQARRTAAIAETYHENVLWNEPDRIIQGTEALNKRAGDILAEAPEFRFTTDGEPIITQNLGVLSWCFGPPTNAELVKGTDIILVEGGKVKVLWTAVTKAP